MFGCKHNKLSEIKPDGFQYCLKCNRAFVPVKPAKRMSSHVLEDLGQETVIAHNRLYHTKTEQNLMHQRCQRCHKRFTFNLTTGEYSGANDDNPSQSECEL